MYENLLSDLVRAWNAQDIDGVIECFAADGSYCAAYGPEPLGACFHGHAAIRAALEAGFRDYPDGRTVVNSVVIVGQRALAEWYFEFTDSHGKRTRVHGCDAYELGGGRIRIKNSYVKQYVPA